MASGVAVDRTCKDRYDEIKKDKTYRYIIFVIEDEKAIKVEKCGARDAVYDDFLQDMTMQGDTECRYGLYDYEYEAACEGIAEGSQKKMVLFLMIWCPDTAKIKKKMLYSSSFDALKKALVGVSKYIQATDSAEASKAEVEAKLRSTDRT